MGRIPYEIARLARIAQALGRAAPPRKPGGRPWPTLWLFTDPDRTPDVLAAASALPRGCGVVLRSFGRRDVERVAPGLAALARSRGLVLLVGADARLAAAIGADGLHLPERMIHRLPHWRARHPSWRFTAAAHGALALLRARRAGADAAFLSPVLPSLSPSASAPLGPIRTAALARTAGLPVYGLGGIDERSARRLTATGLSGLAGVGFAGGLDLARRPGAWP